MKLTYCWLAALTVLLTGCGKEERTEASRFSQALTAKQGNFASANTLEKSFIRSARDWCEGITANGSGKGAALDQNSAVAAELAKNAVAIGAELSQVRQTVDDLTLKSEFTQGVRATLATQLTKRQRYLQEMRAILEQAGPEFLSYKANKAYAGDLFPGGLNKLAAMLERYAIPNDDVAAAQSALKTKYELTAAEL